VTTQTRQNHSDEGVSITSESRSSSVGIVNKIWTERPGILSYATESRPALGSTQPHIQWVPGSLSLGVKWPGREADHLPPSSAEVKEWVELYLHSPGRPSWRSAQLKKDRDNFCLLPF